MFFSYQEKERENRYERERREQNRQAWKDSAFFALKAGGVFFIGCTAVIAFYELHKYEKSLETTTVLAQEIHPIQAAATNTAKAVVPLAESATSYGFTTFSSGASTGGARGAHDFAQSK